MAKFFGKNPSTSKGKNPPIPPTLIVLAPPSRMGQKLLFLLDLRAFIATTLKEIFSGTKI
jgi:hypothetical protein